MITKTIISVSVSKKTLENFDKKRNLTSRSALIEKMMDEYCSNLIW